MNAVVQPMPRRELLLGCGNSRKKAVVGSWTTPEWDCLTTLDFDPACNPDIVHDLNVLPYPFADNEFDEVHAYEVLEHCGRQGDWRFFFEQFNELWRILKPGGFLVATMPSWRSPWAWGDPGHTRVFTPGTLVFLDRSEYEQIGRTAMTDYRPWLKADFEICNVREDGEHLGFLLKARKALKA